MKREIPVFQYDDAPHLLPSGIGLFQKSVGGHIHPYSITRRYLEISIPVPLHRLGEIPGTEDFRGLSRNLVGFVQHEHIAIGTAFTVLHASVPRVPGLELDHPKAFSQISLPPRGRNNWPPPEALRNGCVWNHRP